MQHFNVLATLAVLQVMAYSATAQVFWNEDFNDPGATTRWTTGVSGNATPIGISGLVYMANDACHNYWIINDFNTPLNSPVGPPPIGAGFGSGYNFTAGRRVDCPAGNTPGNNSLHITFRPCSDSWAFGLNNGPPDATDEYSILNANGPSSPGASNSEQMARMTGDVSIAGRCGIRLRGQFFLGGDANGLIAYGTVLFSTNGGGTWQVLEDNIRPMPHALAGTCNFWAQRTWTLPPAAYATGNIRFAFRWRNDGNQPPIATTADYSLGAGFNVDNLLLESVPAPVANFSAGPIAPCKTEPVAITNNSVIYGGLSPTTFTWIIPTVGASVANAGSFSTTIVGPNTHYSTPTQSLVPALSFTANGTYVVGLTASNCAGTSPVFTQTFTVGNCLPQPDFTVNHPNVCAPVPTPINPASPTVAQFSGTNAFTLIPCTGPCVQWAWSFSPSAGVSFVGSTNANSQNPQVQFAIPGVYTVTLTVSNNDGSATAVKTNFINVLDCSCSTPPTGGGPPVTTNLYSEAFNGTLPASGWSNQDLTSPWGNGTFFGMANLWHVSSAEAGMPANTCGQAGGTDGSLHMGFLWPPLVSGAAYLADIFTNRRIRSPIINPIAAGATDPLTLSFDFIGNGEGTTDRAYLQYSLNGGTTWLSPTVAPTTATPALPVGSNLANLKSQICVPQGRWTRVSWVMPAGCAATTQLRIAFVWQSNNNTLGSDPSFAVDDILITYDAPSAGPAVNNWTGSLSNAWNLAGNWSAGIPTSTQVVTIPNTAPNMPVITTAITTAAAIPQGITVNVGASLTIGTGGALGSIANLVPAINNNGTFTLQGGGVVATNVCNQGLITITGNAAPNNHTLTVTGFLNNNGQITSTSTDPGPDVLLRDVSTTVLSEYRGSGTNVGVDYRVENAAGSFATVLNANLACRSLTIGGNLDWTNRSVALTKDFTHLSGSVITTGATLRLVGNGANDIANGGNPQVLTSANNPFVIPFLGVQKPAGHAELTSNFRVDNQMLLACLNSAYLRAMPGFQLHINNNQAIAVLRVPNFASPSAGHVVGVLRRNVQTGLSYEFPLGNLTHYERAVLQTSTLAGLASIAGEFMDIANLSAPAPINVPVLNEAAPNPVPYQQWFGNVGYWKFNPTPSSGFTGAYNLELHCGADFAPPTSPYYTFVKGPNGAMGPWALNGVPAGFSYPMLRRTGITSFSDNVPIESLNPLPVEATPLKADAFASAILLTWGTLSETNNQGFALERTTTPIDAASFRPLGFVPSQNAGNSTSATSYQFVDDNVYPGVMYYYRYRQMDFDGQASYSNIAQAMLSSQGKAPEEIHQLAVYPNPFQQQVQFQFFLQKPEEIELEVFDVSGKRIHQAHRVASAGLQTFEWAPEGGSHTAAGLYLYKLRIGQTRYTGKVVRQ